MWQAWCEKNGLSKTLSGFKHFYYKKTAVILNFCFIRNIGHNFLVPRIIESAPKTFMPIQTPDLHRVIMYIVGRKKQESQNSIRYFQIKNSYMLPIATILPPI